MKFLVTGSAGFIGYHITKMILENFKGSSVIGIDNLNSYYSVKLKKERIKILKNFKRFKFIKIDISDAKKVYSLFKNKKYPFFFNYSDFHHIDFRCSYYCYYHKFLCQL